ncbi:MAG: hypothetical protein WA294_13420, partial [Acidobacteriaceae bacterium]
VPCCAESPHHAKGGRVGDPDACGSMEAAARRLFGTTKQLAEKLAETRNGHPSGAKAGRILRPFGTTKVVP